MVRVLPCVFLAACAARVELDLTSTPNATFPKLELAAVSTSASLGPSQALNNGGEITTPAHVRVALPSGVGTVTLTVSGVDAQGIMRSGTTTVTVPSGGTTSATIDLSPIGAGCQNQSKDPDESDVDCGGTGTCVRCGADAGCQLAGDCAAGLTCNGAKRCAPAPPTCTNGGKDPDESDVDCGGTGTCPRCGADAGCQLAGDCVASLTCNGASRCAPPMSCSNAAKDPGESDVDCGGTSSCARCGGDAGCDAGTDCQTGFCNAVLRCAPNPCLNVAKDPNESDVDCGGASSCPRCDVARRCGDAGDCLTRVCEQGRCGFASGPPFWKTGPLITPRYYHGLATAPDGGLFVVGGTGSGGPLDSIERYDVASDSFVPMGPPLPLPRIRLAAAWLGGRLYAIGGEPDSGLVQSLGADDAGWRSEPRIGHERKTPGAAVAQGRIWVFGGSDDSLNPTDAVESFDGTQWANAAPIPEGLGMMPAHREGPGVARGSDGRIWVVGGVSGGGSVGSVAVFNPALGNWANASGDLPTPRNGFGAEFGADGRLWAAGGATSFSTPSAVVEARELDAGTWARLPPLSVERSQCQLARLPDGRLIAIGGTPSGAPPAATELYGPSVSVTPSTVAQGGIVTVAGDNFAADAGVTVTLLPERLVLGRGGTDATGALTAPLLLNLPAVDAGPHDVLMVDDRSRYPVQRAITVQP